MFISYLSERRKVPSDHAAVMCTTKCMRKWKIKLEDEAFFTLLCELNAHTNEIIKLAIERSIHPTYLLFSIFNFMRVVGKTIHLGSLSLNCF